MLNNLYFPENTLTKVLNNYDPKLLVPIESLLEQDKVVSTCTNPTRSENGKDIVYQHDLLFINKIVKLNNNGENNKTPFYKLTYSVNSGKTQDMIVPGFVKFYSRTSRSYCRLNLLSKTDVLVDYQLYDVKILNIEECEKPESAFIYKLTVSSSVDWISFYYNGILGTI